MGAMTTTSTDCEPKVAELLDKVIQEIRSSDIIQDEMKETSIRRILTELDNYTSQCWFNCKMILFQNRYNSVSKDSYLNWLVSTHLKDLVELQGGMVKNAESSES